MMVPWYCLVVYLIDGDWSAWASNLHIIVSLMGLVGVMALLVSGTALAFVTASFTEKDFASPSAQLLPWAKYLTIVGYTAAERRTQKGSRKILSRKGTELVYTIAVLSIVAYCCYCVGCSLAGTGLALGMHAAAGQTFTALLSQLILKRKLTSRKIWAVIVVNVGLLLRAFAPAPGKSNISSFLEGITVRHVLGGTAIIGSSICYALLGIVFDHLLRTEQPNPPYSQIMEVEGWIGMLVLTLWQAVFTVPNWDKQIAQPLVSSGSSYSTAIALLLTTGCIFVWHYHNMSSIFKTDGAVAVGLINAVRGAIVSVLAGWAHCSPERPGRCNSFWTVASAMVVTAGAALWVVGPSSKSDNRKAATQSPGSEDIRKTK